MTTLLQNATLINEGKEWTGSVVIKDQRIHAILPENELPTEPCHRIINARGCLLLPGVIDPHVHFRDPGLTQKADMRTETRAAVAGGVTSFMDMPNTQPQTITLEAMEEKYRDAAKKCLANYSFYLGATHSNVHLLREMDTSKVCGVKVFMGASTGNMLVDRIETLREIFSTSPILIATHCEDQQTIRQQAEKYRALYGDDPDIAYHPAIRSEEACYLSTELAVRLARETGARLHVLHLTTERELSLFSHLPLSEKRITAEVCVPHLLFDQRDYASLGARIKCNPSIKRTEDRDALRRALNSGLLDIIATDHAPHLLSEKEGGALKAVSGMPSVQYSLISMLQLADEGVLPRTEVVQKMCHNPAEIYQVDSRGYLREGYYADIVLVRRVPAWTLTSADVQSKCGWSPLEGRSYTHRVWKTFVNGSLAYDDGAFSDTPTGVALRFCR